MYDYVWLCMTLYDCIWQFMAICVTLYDNVWLCITMYDHVWPCTATGCFKKNALIENSKPYVKKQNWAESTVFLLLWHSNNNSKHINGFWPQCSSILFDPWWLWTTLNDSFGISCTNIDCFLLYWTLFHSVLLGLTLIDSV